MSIISVMEIEREIEKGRKRMTGEGRTRLKRETERRRKEVSPIGVQKGVSGHNIGDEMCCTKSNDFSLFTSVRKRSIESKP